MEINSFCDVMEKSIQKEMRRTLKVTTPREGLGGRRETFTFYFKHIWII